MKGDIQRVLLFSVLSQAAGFAKSLLIAYYFGVSAELDGYYLAQIVPATISAVLSGALQSGLIPTYLQLRARGEEEQVARLAGSVVSWVLLTGLVASGTLSIFSPSLIAVVSPRATPEVTDAAVTSMTVLAYLLLLNLVVDSLGLLLNARLHFAAAALAPTLNAAVSSIILFLAPEWGLQNLIWGTICGLAVQLAFVMAAVKLHKVPLRFSLRLPSSMRSVLRVGAGSLPGTLFSNLSGAVPQLWVTALGSGALSVFSYANRLHGAATQALAIGVSTVLLPHFASLIAAGKKDLLAEKLARSLPTVSALAAAAAVWVYFAGDPLLKIIFERGRFDAVASLRVGWVWFWLTLGLLPTLWGITLAKVLQANQRSLQLSAFAGVGLVVNVVLCELLHERFGVNGIAIALGLTYAVTATLCHRAVARELSESAQLPAFDPARAAQLFVPIAFALAACLVLNMVIPVDQHLLLVGVYSFVVAFAAFVSLRMKTLGLILQRWHR